MSRSKKILTLLNISLDEKSVSKKDEELLPTTNKALEDIALLTALKSPNTRHSNILIDQGKRNIMMEENFYVDPVSGILVSDENNDDIEDVSNEEHELLPATNKTLEERTAFKSTITVHSDILLDQGKTNRMEKKCYVNPVLGTLVSDVENCVEDTDVDVIQSSLVTEDNIAITNVKEVESHRSDIVLIDKSKLDVSVSKRHSKKYFCTYCNTLITSFGRHLVTVHTNKKEVADILIFPKGHPERHKRISNLRKEAQFKYNTDSNINGGTIIVKRRPSESKKRTASHYLPCRYCKEMFSKLSLRAHVLKCNPHRVQGQRNVLLESRRFQMNISNKASTRLARDILSRCKDDIITSIILFDDLCILYGNKLSKKYRLDQDGNMIRTRLREIGRFIHEFRLINPNVPDLREILDPKYYDQIVEAINEVAGLDEATGRYKSPSTAYNLGLQIKSIALLLETQCIKEKDAIKRESVRDLLCLIKDGFRTDINRTVTENQTQNKRHKKVKLPTAEDIVALKNYLKNGLKEAYGSLKNEFSKKAWKNLSGFTLISLQLFNRRRAGELERILIQDYKTYEFANEDDDVFKGLCESDKRIAKHYARFCIRGKLNRQVPVIISKEFISYIDLILKYREEYGVSNTNPYVFGTPSEVRNTYLRACILMRNYSKACGAPNPDSLRGTELRKQIATACALYNLSDPLVEDIANHLGHHINIHKKIYRQSTGREVPAIAQILLKALGEEEEDNLGKESTNASESFEEHASLDALNDLIGQENNMFDKTQHLDIRCNTELAENPNEFKVSEENLKELKEASKENPNLLEQLCSRKSSTSKRSSWTTPEKQAVRNEFGDLIEAGIVPTFFECIELQEKNECLRNRTPPQIKSFIAYETKKLRSSRCKDTGKRTWTTPEKHVVRKEFKENLEKRSLPSLLKCKEVIAANPILKYRTPQVLKAYVNNLNRKAKCELGSC